MTIFLLLRNMITFLLTLFVPILGGLGFLSIQHPSVFLKVIGKSLYGSVVVYGCYFCWIFGISIYSHQVLQIPMGDDVKTQIQGINDSFYDPLTYYPTLIMFFWTGIQLSTLVFLWISELIRKNRQSS